VFTFLVVVTLNTPHRGWNRVSDPNIITFGTNHDIMFLFRLSLAYIGSFGAV
jgi:hypothetical protein